MKTHKDLPPGSQQWALEVDALLQEVDALKDVVRRLAGNAGLDFSNPMRGINQDGTPSVQNPVGQKLSSLADVSTYTVADKQVLSWSQQGQKWLPVTLPTPSAGGTIDLTGLTYSSLTQGYGTVDSPTKFAYTAAGMVGTEPFRHAYVETWSTGATYLGTGNWNTGPYAMVEMDVDGFGRPYVQIDAYDFADGTSGTTVFNSFQVRIDGAYFIVHRCATADRPAGLGTASDRRGAMVFDTDLNIPIWWNGTSWINAIGTSV